MYLMISNVLSFPLSLRASKVVLLHLAGLSDSHVLTHLIFPLAS